ncbi:MAG: restriction endonuclease subunit S [Cytophagales bacterium]|nr:restriction endonuclease subunit S [Cytophagales bacterium]
MKQGKMSEPRLSGLKDGQDLGTKKILKSSNQTNPDSDNMKQGWEIKKLGEVCKVIAGQSPEGKFYNSEGNGMPFYQGKKEYGEKYIGEPTTWTTKITKEAEAGDILMSVRAPVGPVNFSTQKICIGRGLAAIRAGKNIDKEFLFNFLIKHENEIIGNAGAVFNSINKTQIESLEIPLPPLPEQQRIISILDEAFAAIAKAKANAEQNLKNAKELFESYLQGVFENGDWETKTIQEITKVVNGYAFASNDFKPTNTVKSVKITNVGVKEFVEEADNYLPEKFKETLKDFQVKEGNIVIALTRTIISAGLKVAVVPASYDGALVNQRVAALVPNEKLVNQNFLYFYLTTSGVAKYVLEHVNTLMQPNLSINDLKNMPVPCPPLKDQQTIVSQLDALRAETQKLEAVYQQKIADLEELKKSILQKAFAGELKTSATASVSVNKVIPLQKVEGISATDLQAGITAIALQKHSKLNKQDSFGHVKVEKIIHLAEYILSIDMERNPVKDAAGPNDFPHAKKVESRAAKAGYYAVTKRMLDQETAYAFTPGPSINLLIQKTQYCLGERNEVLSQLLKLVVPMKTQQAEIVATVYAAWNNLILKGDAFTDEDIVIEARENWHKKKLSIQRDKFFKALDWMRKNELLIPRGNGKIVKVKST